IDIEEVARSDTFRRSLQKLGITPDVIKPYAHSGAGTHPVPLYRLLKAGGGAPELVDATNAGKKFVEGITFNIPEDRAKQIPKLLEKVKEKVAEAIRDHLWDTKTPPPKAAEFTMQELQQKVRDVIRTTLANADHSVKEDRFRDTAPTAAEIEADKKEADPTKK